MIEINQIIDEPKFLPITKRAAKLAALSTTFITFI